MNVLLSSHASVIVEVIIPLGSILFYVVETNS